MRLKVSSEKLKIAMSASNNTVFEVMYAIVKLMYVFFSSMSTIIFEHCFIVCVVFRSPCSVSFSHIFDTFDKHLFTGISMVICKIGWSIRSWLSDYISFSLYKSYCRYDIYWILVAFMIAASALIKVSRLYGLCRHLYTQLIYWHCAVILYTQANLLSKRFWILNPESWRPFCLGLNVLVARDWLVSSHFTAYMVWFYSETCL